MRFGRGVGGRANEAVNRMTSRVDAESSDAALRLTQLIVLAVRILRVPTLALLVVPIPFIATILLVAATSDGWFRVVGLVIGLAMAAVSVTFGVRRAGIVKAASEPEQLGTELGIMVSMTGRVDETRDVVAAIGGGGGWRVFSRLQGVWRGVGMTGRWIEEIGDLPRAKYFGPPRVGTTVTMTIAALWLVPVSVVVALFTIIGAIAGSIG